MASASTGDAIEICRDGRPVQKFPRSAVARLAGWLFCFKCSRLAGWSDLAYALRLGDSRRIYRTRR